MPRNADDNSLPKTRGARANDGFSGVDAVERALKVLDAFDDREPALALRDISARSGLTKSTILRLAVSLERFGYIVRDSDGLFRLGPALWRLGSLFRRNLDLAGVVRPVLESLVAKTNESASFYVPRGTSGVCLYRVNSARLARDHVEEGEIIPFGLGSSGHILEAFTNSGSEASAAIREARVYVSLGERDPDVAGISAAVLGHDGELIGAVSLSGLITRFNDEKVAAYSRLILQAALEIEARMGVDEEDD